MKTLIIAQCYLNANEFFFFCVLFLRGTHDSNSIVMLEKQHEINQKAFDKIQKSSDDLLRERDTIHKELKRMESMCVILDNNLHEFRLEN